MEAVYEEDLLTLCRALGLDEENDAVQRILYSDKVNSGARYYSGDSERPALLIVTACRGVTYRPSETRLHYYNFEDGRPPDAKELL